VHDEVGDVDAGEVPIELSRVQGEVPVQVALLHKVTGQLRLHGRVDYVGEGLVTAVDGQCESTVTSKVFEVRPAQERDVIVKFVENLLIGLAIEFGPLVGVQRFWKERVELATSELPHVGSATATSLIESSKEYDLSDLDHCRPQPTRAHLTLAELLTAHVEQQVVPVLLTMEALEDASERD
jgi:hypothetical protein